jgi:hypothetical protein
MGLGWDTVFIAVASFIAGRVFLQTEAVLLQKRKVYQEYLEVCLTAHEAYKQSADNTEDVHAQLEKLKPKGEFFLYASRPVIILCGLHVQSLEKAFVEVDETSQPVHPAFARSITCYNQMLAEMRRDVLGWSLQGMVERFFGSSRARKLLKSSDQSRR